MSRRKYSTVGETERSCEAEECTATAVWFYFKHDTQVSVCSLHRPALTKIHSIDLINLIRSPQDEALLKQRKEEVTTGQKHLSSLQSHTQTQLEACLQALAAHQVETVKTVEKAYEGERRRVRQHFNQVEVMISTVLSKFEHYLRVKEYVLPDIARNVIRVEPFPTLSRFHILDNRLELHTAISHSVYLHSSPLPSASTEPVLQGSPGSYTEALEAYWQCCDELEVTGSRELEEMKSKLEANVARFTIERESALLTLQTADTPYVSRLLSQCAASIAQHQAQGEHWQVLDLYEAALEAAGPETVSREVGEMYWKYAEWYKQFAPWPVISKPEKLLKEAVRILEPHFHTTISAISVYSSLGHLYLEQNRALEACQVYSKAMGVLCTYWPKERQTVEVMLRYGTALRLAGEKDEAEEAWKEAISLAISDLPDTTASEIYLAEGKYLIEQHQVQAAWRPLSLACALAQLHFPQLQVIAAALSPPNS